MAVLNVQAIPAQKRKIHSLKIDMTPMVDLGFLLITFFIFTASLSQPRVTRLIMPAEGEPMAVPESKTMTLLLDKEKAYVYEGRWEEAIAQNKIVQTGYSLQHGIGKQIRQKQKGMAEKKDLVVLIKPLQSSTYGDVITALDEMQINGVHKYSVLNASAEEVSFVRSK